MFLRKMLFVMAVISITFKNANSNNVSPAIQNLRKHCEFQSGVDPSIIDDIRHKHDYSYVDLRTKWYAYCLYRAVGRARPDGELHKEQFRNLLPRLGRGNAEMVIDVCSQFANLANKEPAEIFWDRLMCFKKNYPVHFTLL